MSLHRKHHNQKILASIALIGYISFGFLGFFHLLEMASKHVHHEGTSDCPFVRMEHSLCTATLTSHVRIWQDATSLLLPFIYSLWVPIVFFFVGLALVFLRSEQRKLLYAKNQAPPRHNNVLQFLFSQGLLNPKTH